MAAKKPTGKSAAFNAAAEMKHQITFVIGDHSGDSHEQTENFIFQTNYAPADIRAAYEASVRKHGIDFVEDVFSQFGCKELDSKTVKKMTALGYDFSKLDSGTDWVYPGELMDMLRWYICLSLKDAKFEEVKPEVFNNFEKERKNFGFGLLGD